MKTNQPNFYFETAEEAESAFYSAFETADIQLMDAVLADKDVFCIHPRSLPIIGRENVLKSWSLMLSQNIEPMILTEVLKKTVYDDIAVHLVAERIAKDYQHRANASLVLATNVYVRQSNGWRMMEHHASIPANQEGASKQRKEPIVTHKPPTSIQ